MAVYFITNFSAKAGRQARYRGLTPVSPPYAFPACLPIQPQGSGTTAVVEGLVGGIVLHIRLPGAGHHGGVRVHIVLLLGHDDRLLAAVCEELCPQPDLRL